VSLPDQEANSVKELHELAVAVMNGAYWPFSPLDCRFCLGEGVQADGYDCKRCRGAGILLQMDAYKVRLRDATKHYPYPSTIEEKFNVRG
jgi:hypothetical protein